MYKVHAVWHGREHVSMAEIGSMNFQGGAWFVPKGGDVGVGAAVMSGHVGCAMELRRMKCLGQRSVGRLCGVSTVCLRR